MNDKKAIIVRRDSIITTSSVEEATKAAVTIAAENWNCYDLDVVTITENDTLEPIPYSARSYNTSRNNNHRTVTTPEPNSTTGSALPAPAVGRQQSFIATVAILSTINKRELSPNTAPGMTYSEQYNHLNYSQDSPYHPKTRGNTNESTAVMMTTPPTPSSYTTYPYMYHGQPNRVVQCTAR